jgi:subfamily B ATP-binding cassette protein MsbA
MKVLLRLFKFVKPYTLWIAVAIISMLVVSLSSILMAYLVKPLFDNVLVGNKEVLKTGSFIVKKINNIYTLYINETTKYIPLRWAVTLSIFIVLIIKSISTFFSTFSFGVIGISIVNDLRNYLYGRIIYQPLKFYAKEPVGTLISRIVSDVNFILTAFGERLGDIFQETFTVIGLLIFIFSINFKLSLLSLLLMPLMLLPIIKFTRSLRKASHKSMERMADMVSVLSQTLIGIKIVKAFTAEEYAKENFKALSLRQLKHNIKARKIHDLNGPIMEFIGITFALGMFIYAGFLIEKGQMSVGSFSSFLAALFMLYTPIKKINKANLAIQQAISAGERIFKLADQENEKDEEEKINEIPQIKDKISFENVSFSYNEKEILSNISFEIPKGKTVAIVGASGSGKSTIASLLLGFYEPNKGSIKIDGVDIRNFNKKALREYIGFVSQDPILFNDTILNNICFGEKNPDIEKVNKVAEMSYSKEFIESLPLKYETNVGELGSLLSGGERQRIAIARALYKDPPVLIFDEATSNLDTNAERIVQKAIDSILKDRTSLVIAHRLSTVVGSFKILVLEEGKIVEEGTHNELMEKKGKYFQLFKIQTGE